MAHGTSKPPPKKTTDNFISDPMIKTKKTKKTKKNRNKSNNK